jgi:serine/threonine protein kinase
MPLGEGSVLGRRYRLVALVGRGGMGRVWHGHDDLLHRDVAVKEVIFPPGLTASEREVHYERTFREARSAARLSHRGIVTVHDVVEEDDRPWIVMEFVRARSLQDVIDQDGRLSPGQVAEIGGQMLAALRAAHAARVLHRDVKPANVLLDTAPSGGQVSGTTRVVITDFGIASMEGDATLTQTGLVLGSPAYIAPERVSGEKASPASDLWALGATLYAACEGRAPHDRVEAMAALAAVLTEEPAPPIHAGPLAPVLLGLLVKDPALRMTAGQAAEGLARVARGGAPAKPSVRPDTAATPQDVPDGMTLLEPAPYAGASSMREDDRAAREHPGTVRAYEGPPPGRDRPEQAYEGPDREYDGPERVHDGPARERTARGRGKVLVLSGVAVLAVVVAAVTFLAYRPARSASSHPSAPSSPAASPSAPSPPADSTPAVPPGFNRSHGPGGATLAVPHGWTRQASRSGASVRWMDTATGAHVQVDTIPWGVQDPVDHWRVFEKDAVRNKTLPGFEPIHLGDRFAPRGWPAADLEYTWLTKGRGTLRAYDRGFTANGHQYAILVAAPADRWSRYSGFLDTIFASFQPAP